MGRESLSALRKAGVTERDIQSALEMQALQRAEGLNVSTLAELCGIAVQQSKQRRNRLRNRAVEQATQSLDSSETLPHDPRRQSRAEQLEFDFFGGNMSLGHEYFDTVKRRLDARPLTLSQKGVAVLVLQVIGRNLSWQKPVCGLSAGELAEEMPCTRQQMSRILQLLEEVGAIYRVPFGREKAIVVNPEGIFYGKIANHQQVRRDFKEHVRDQIKVIDGGRAA